VASNPADTGESLKRLAQHARWAAGQLAGTESADRLRGYADELKERADGMGKGHA
jgi:hypothetical protein